MLNKKFITVTSIFIVITFCFVLLMGQTSIRLVNSTEVGDQIVVKFPFWVSKERARNMFSIDPNIDGEFSWIENELHFVPTSGLEPDIDYKISVSNKLSALLLFPESKIIRVTSALIESYIRPQINETKFIDINLETMILTLYENGKVYKTFPVIGKGNPNRSPTPEGKFSVKTKELNHWSSKAYVWMPYSMHFYSDYFIHGWPYWPSGKRLTSIYSGGCIRLLDPDSIEVFNFATIGMPVIVHSTKTVPLGQIRSGDLIRFGLDSHPYLVKIVGDKYFKRILNKDEFINWYSHLSSRGIKIVSKDVLDRFQSSRWVHLPGEIDIYELNPNWVKHFMACNDKDCWDIWSIYGWDPDELFTVTEEELNYYRLGPDIDLPPAPWAEIQF